MSFVALVARVLIFSKPAADAFVASGGLALVRSILEKPLSARAPTLDALQVLSQLARFGAEFYEPMSKCVDRCGDVELTWRVSL